MVIKPFRKHLPVGGWTQKIAMMFANLIDLDDIERMEGILEAPAQIFLQFFMISRGSAVGKYQNNQNGNFEFNSVLKYINTPFMYSVKIHYFQVPFKSSPSYLALRPL